MNATARHRRPFVACLGLVVPLALLAGCSAEDSGLLQGYVEGEFVYVASPRDGMLETLAVSRGDMVTRGQELFALEHARETAARDEAERRLAQARANLEDAKKGKRPTEIQALEAQLQQAQATAAFSEKDIRRLERLGPSGAATISDLERARSQRDADQARVLQLQAELETARLGARSDQIEAAEMEVQARTAALERAEWNLAQKKQSATEAGVVFDTLFRQGEWVGPGKPVVAILPPGNIKVRAFVPEPRVGAIKLGDEAKVIVDGVAEPLTGEVSFLSPRAEFTPPVIYSRESRSKLVFMIELTFDADTASKLHPGQPVDVELAGQSGEPVAK